MTTIKTAVYVSKDDFYNALVDYKAQCDANPDNNPPVSDYIGDCIIKIAEGVARRPNFNGYSWRDDMIGGAIETCLRYVKSFDPERGTNPFGYFTQVCWFSFIGKIKLENKQGKIKRAMVHAAGVDVNTYSLQDHDEDGSFNLNLQEFLTTLGPDDAQDVTPEKVTVGALEKFFE